MQVAGGKQCDERSLTDTMHALPKKCRIRSKSPVLGFPMRNFKETQHAIHTNHPNHRKARFSPHEHINWRQVLPTDLVDVQFSPDNLFLWRNFG